jgi:hypothetical protein
MEIDPLQVSVGERKFLAFPHDEDRAEYLVEHPEVDPRDVAIIMVTIFRNKGYMDMLEIVEIDEAEDDFSTHIVLGRLAMVDYAVGFSLDEKRQEELDETHKLCYRFGEKFGWWPSVTIEDEPSEFQEAIYMRWSLHDLEETKGVPWWFIEADNEDDGA